MSSSNSAPAQPADPFERNPRVSLGAVGLITVIFLTEAVIGLLLLALNPQYPISRLHAGAKFSGFAISAYGAAKMPGQPISGWLVDRVGPRLILVAGLMLSLPAIVLMERLHSAWLYVACWVLFGLALAVIWPAVYAIIGHSFRPSLQGRLLALVSMGQVAGTAAGVGIGAVVIDRVSYRAAFAVALIVEALALAVAFVVLHGAGTHPRESIVAAENGPRSSSGGLSSILNANVVLLMAVIALVSTAVAMLTPDLKPYSANYLHLTYSSFVLLLIPPAAVAAALLVPSGYIADRWGRGLPMRAGLSLFAVGLLTLTFIRVPIYASLCACVAATGYVLALPALSASLLDLSSSNNRGLLTGVTTSIQAVGLIIGPAIGGPLIDAYGPIAPMRVAVLIVALAFALSLVYTGRISGSQGGKVTRPQRATG